MTEREREVYEAAAAAWETARRLHYEEYQATWRVQQAEIQRLEAGWRRADERADRLQFELRYGKAAER